VVRILEDMFPYFIRLTHDGAAERRTRPRTTV
jgi:hypothetical protein